MCDWNGNPVSIAHRERVSVRAGEINKTKIVLDSIVIEEAKKICASLKPKMWFVHIVDRFQDIAFLLYGVINIRIIYKMLKSFILLLNIV